MTSDSSPPKPWRPTGFQIAASLASLALAVILLGFLLPKATGADWGEAWDVITELGPVDFLAMTGLWAVGLWLYTFVYTASLPGLRHAQALNLNLTGSLVSNLLPFGGAAGVANTYGLTFSWGFGGVATSLMVLVSGLANLLIRIVLPVVGLVALMSSDATLPVGASGVLRSTLLVLAVLAVLVILILVNSRVAGWVGMVGDVFLRACAKLLGRPQPKPRLRPALIHMQKDAVAVLRKGWYLVAFGMIAYYASELALFWWALDSLGAPIGIAEVTAAFALSRVLTSVVVTPSGVGISEAGTAGLLVLFGTPPAVAAAAVLVLHFYTYLIEIPAGLVGWGWVLVMRKRWGRTAAASA